MNQTDSFHSILVVIVLYKVRIGDSPAYLSLAGSLLPPEKEHIHLLIYDNSPEAYYDPSAIVLPHTYIHNPSNPGLSVAYNTALNNAVEKKKQWLLLLDQDTTINREYLAGAMHAASGFTTEEDVAAIVPEIHDRHSVIVSPCRVTSIGRIVSFPVGSSRLLEGRVSALNSGALLKVKFLLDTGGFARDFPLDMLDHFMFRKICREGKKVFAIDRVILHDLSVTSEKYMDAGRYPDFLAAERRFFRDESRFTFFCYHLVLAARCLKHIMKGRKDIAGMTWRFLFRKR